jgi:hypothetical protein
MPFPKADPTKPPRVWPARPVNVTYEFDNEPPITVRLAIPARSAEHATSKAYREMRRRPEFKGRRPSSVLVLAFKR